MIAWSIWGTPSARCRHLKHSKYEQIIVADAPPETTMERIRSLVRQYDNETRPLRLAVLNSVSSGTVPLLAVER